MPLDEPAPPSTAPDPHAPLRVAVVVALLLLAGCYAGVALGRYVVNDDYLFLYTAWAKAAEQTTAGEATYLGSSPLVVALAGLFRLCGDTLTPLWIARLALVAWLGAVGALSYAFARALFGRPAALLTPVCLLAATPLLHRGVDLRTDALVAGLWLGAMALLTAWRAGQPSRPLGAGALLAMACLLAPKAAVIAPWVALALLVGPTGGAPPATPAARARQAAAGAGWVLLGAVAATAAFAAVWALLGELGGLVEAYGQFLHSVQAPRPDPSARWRTLAATLHGDLLFWCLVFVGAVTAVRGSAPRRPRALAAGTLALGALTVALNPAYHAYNLVILLGLLAPFAGRALALAWARAAQLEGPRRVSAAAALALVPLLASGGTLVASTLRPSNAHQLRWHRFLAEHTDPTSPVFALEGLGLFRPTNAHWHLPWWDTTRYAEGAFTFRDELAAHPPQVVVTSYRVPAWLTPADRAWLSARYVPLAPYVFVPGARATQLGVHTIELLVAGRYRVTLTGHASLDDAPLTDEQELDLEAGSHRLTLHEGSVEVRRAYDEAALALLANPERLPYLVPPDLAFPAPAED